MCVHITNVACFFVKNVVLITNKTMNKNILKLVILSIFVVSAVFFIGIGDVLAAAPTCSMNATPSNISAGGSSSISWSSSRYFCFN